jgi:LacI family gluconate utilization system Gnt-I transcriptional repressor
MEDVARAAGVSMITVSRALSAPEKLAPATLAKVRSAIDALRYVPNLTAGSLASKRSHIVAAIVPTIANSIFSETIDGLSQTLATRGYQLLLGQTHYRDDEESALVDAFLGRRADGIVLTGLRHPRGVRAALQRAAIPVVETWDFGPRPIDMLVGFSNQAAGEAAARYLAGKGYRSLGFIGGGDDRSAARLAGFRVGALACRLGDVAVVDVASRSTPGEGAAALAVFCSNDMLAAGAVFECRRRRLKVPGDVAVMGFADLPIAAGMEPALTTIQVRSHDMGRRVGAMLLRRFEGGSLDERIVDLGFAVVERASA